MKHTTFTVCVGGGSDREESDRERGRMSGSGLLGGTGLEWAGSSTVSLPRRRRAVPGSSASSSRVL